VKMMFENIGGDPHFLHADLYAKYSLPGHTMEASAISSTYCRPRSPG
jgi:hypothetical protein